MPILSILVVGWCHHCRSGDWWDHCTSSSERSLVEERLGRYLEDEEAEKEEGGEGGSALTENE